MLVSTDASGAAPPAAEITETHLSVVAFVGDRAYKAKKSVDLGFVDFTSVEARRVACEREVALNRRLAPDVYLGVATLHDVDGSVAEHLVVMRRMPPERRLSTLVTDGDPRVADQLRRLARQLAAFHAAADRSPEIAAAGSVDAVAANWEESFTQLDPLVGDLVDGEVHDRVRSLVRRYLAGRGDLFADRMRSGQICDGHGDLQAADIFCLDDGPRVLDCIEFNDRFRYGDVANDVAFLAMDLDRLGAPELGRQFLDEYREFSGATWPPSLVEHFVAYRAHVRCKVACLRAVQLDGAARAEPAGEAARLARMALRYLERARVRLVLVGGLPGTGKSTLAAGVGAATGWTVLRSDAVRKESAGLDPSTPAPATFGTGLYDPAATAATYDELLRRAGVALRGGESVVLDATWLDPAQRAAAARVADDALADLDAVVCELPAAEAAQRMAARAARGGDPSDATAEVAARLAHDAAPWPEALVVDTGAPPEVAVTEALRLLEVPALAPDVARSPGA